MYAVTLRQILWKERGINPFMIHKRSGKSQKICGHEELAQLCDEKIAII